MVTVPATNPSRCPSRHKARSTVWVAGIVGPVAFVTSWVVAGAIRTGYDPATDAISRLAEQGAPHRWIVLSGMVTFGLCMLVFAWGAASLPTAARWLLVLAGVTSFAAAAFPCSPGCPGWGTATDNGHVLAAGLHYIVFAGAAIVVGVASKDDRFRRWSLAAGMASGLFLALQGLGVGPNGLMQRIGLTIADVWLVTLAFRVRAAARST